jgi:CheY-like chemotaxis protein
MPPATTLLVIDDDPAITRVLELAIDLLDGWSAQFAEDEVGARAGLAAGLPNYILLDMNLAASDGLDVLASLRADHDLSETRVVLMTAGIPRLSPQSLADAGVSQVLTKPFDPLALPELLAP